jgi:hypothetical protein
MATKIKESVSEAFEEKAIENGQMTGERMANMLGAHQDQLLGLVQQKLSEIQLNAPAALQIDYNHDDVANNNLPDEADDNGGTVDDAVIAPTDALRYLLYQYEGRFWHVPHEFVFRSTPGWILGGRCGLGICLSTVVLPSGPFAN